MKSKMVAPQANIPRPAPRQTEAPGGGGGANVRARVGGHAPSVGARAFTRGSSPRFAPGQNSPTATRHSPHKPPTNSPVIQRMEDERSKGESLGYKVGSFLAPKISKIFNIPNIFEMCQFTSCVCLVFNQAGMSLNEVKEISGDYRKTLEDVQERWELGGQGRLFRAMCPYDTGGGNVSQEFTSFCVACTMDPAILGTNPLIVVIGHCSPGSSSISGDKGTGLKFSVAKVLDVIRPLMTQNCTILLSPCSTSVSTNTSPSFQDQLIREINDDGAPEVYTIGTNSTSAPVRGTVLSTGYTVKHTVNGGMDMEDFKILPVINIQTGQVAPKKKKRKKVRVITYIPTAEEAKKGKTEEYYWEKRD